MKLTLTKSSFLMLLFAIALTGCSIPSFKEWQRQLNEEQTRSTNAAIQKDPILKELNTICEELPFDDNFIFVTKGMFSHGDKALDFYYNSDHAFDYADAVFRERLEKSGWTFFKDDTMTNRNSKFKKDNFQITIQYGGMNGANYSFTCRYHV